jgi:hypothetical protein
MNRFYLTTQDLKLSYFTFKILDFVEEPLMMGTAMLHDDRNEAMHSQFLIILRKYKNENLSFQIPNAFRMDGERAINNAFYEVFHGTPILNCASHLE